MPHAFLSCFCRLARPAEGGPIRPRSAVWVAKPCDRRVTRVDCILDPDRSQPQSIPQCFAHQKLVLVQCAHQLVSSEDLGMTMGLPRGRDGTRLRQRAM